jgi:dTDP-4-dehydrorhamnose 3,5-epimerase
MTERFELSEASLPGVYRVERRPRSDDRGWLERLYDPIELAPLLGSRAIAQVNRTLTRRRGSVRGMHFQAAPSAEVKVVTCLRGAVFDVAVDLRRGSPTLLRWHAELLDAAEHRSVLIPEGFAHGFQTLADDAELLYFHTAAYDPAAEGGVHPLDPLIAVTWPLEVELLSDRDRSHPFVGADFKGIA